MLQCLKTKKLIRFTTRSDTRSLSKLILSMQRRRCMNKGSIQTQRIHVRLIYDSLMDKESIFNSPRILFLTRCSFFSVSKISNEQSSSSSSNDSFVNSSSGCSNGGPEVGNSQTAKETHWLVTTPGIDKSAYDLQKNEKVSCSAFQGKTT